MSTFAARPNRFVQHAGSQKASGRKGRLGVILVGLFILSYMFFVSSISRTTSNATPDSIEATRTEKVMAALQEQVANAENRAHQAEDSLKSAVNELKSHLPSLHLPASLASQDADDDEAEVSGSGVIAVGGEHQEEDVETEGNDDDEDAVTTTDTTRIQLPVYTNDFVHRGEERQKYLRTLTKKVGRVYCGVPSMYSAKKLVRWGEILRTWGKRCDVIKFFVDPVYEKDEETGEDGIQVELPKVFTDEVSGMSGDIVVVPMVRKSGNQCWLGGAKGSDGKPKTIPCRHILEKVQRMWSYAGEHDLDTAEWFLKVDDDTFYMPENMKKYIAEQGWKADEPHYFGHLLMHHGKGKGLIAGALAAFSRETLRRIKPVYDNLPREYGDRSGFKHGRCVDRDGATEEVTTSICLRQVDVHPEHTFDDQGRERVLLFPPSGSFNMRRSPSSKGWFFNGKDALVKGGNLCCAVDAFAFHGFKKTNDMIKIDEVLYGDGEKLEKARELVAENGVTTEEGGIGGLFKSPGGQSSLMSGARLSWDSFKKEVAYLSAVREALTDFTVNMHV